MSKKQVFKCEGASYGLISVRRLQYPSGRVFYDVVRNRKRVSLDAVYDSLPAAIEVAVDLSKCDLRKVFGEGIV